MVAVYCYALGLVVVLSEAVEAACSPRMNELSELLCECSGGVSRACRVD